RGGARLFSAGRAVQPGGHERLRDLQPWIQEPPRHDLSVGTLAHRAAMSPRNFARVFARDVGTTPARFVTTVRVETARRLLEETSEDLETVCARSGLGTTEAMRRAFQHIVGMSPVAYRDRSHREGAHGGAHSPGRSGARRVV